MRKKKICEAMIKGVTLCLLGLVLSYCAGEQGTVVEKGVIKADTTWQNQMIIKGDVEVAKGAILTIMPGTIVRFAKIEAGGAANLYTTEEDYFERAELIVKGRLIAKGTKGNMIRFTSAEGSPRPGDWGAINFQDSAGNVLQYCELSYGDTAVHGHGAGLVVENCSFHDNGVALGYKNVPKYRTKCVASIKENHITRNGGGVLCGKDSKSVIVHNDISQNKLYGVFGKQPYVADVKSNNIMGNGKGVLIYSTKGFRLRENNISESEGYQVSLLEGQRWDVDARGNWWGTKDKARIKESIWDKEEEPALGRVNFSKLLGSPVKNAGVTG